MTSDIGEITNLSPIKRELLLRRLDGSKEPQPLLLPRRTASGPAPLSYSQEWMWLLDQTDPGNTGYLIPLALRLEGVLEIAALGRALSAIVERHAVLRTRIVAEDGGAVQVVETAMPVALPMTDLSAVAGAVQAAAVAAAQAEEAERPFDLFGGPVLRCRLLRLGPQLHVLLLTIHHIAFDDWSVGVLLRELGALYEGFVTGAPAGLSSPALQYADYACWQREWLRGPALARELAYWRGRLAGAPMVLELPIDRPRPVGLSTQGASQAVTLPADLVEGLRALCRREGVTLFMAVLTAFQVVLARWSGQQDMLIGVPIAGRTEAALEGMIGCFINMLVLRLDLPGLTVREALRRVRETALSAYAHQALPFARLVEALAPAREVSQTPLVQVGFDLHNTPPPPLRLGPLRAMPVSPGSRGAKLDLFLVLEETPEGGLTGSLDYRAALFDPTTMARLAGHLATVLAGMVAQPEQALAHLPLLSAAERQELLVVRNATAAAYPRDACLSQLFEAQVARSPQAVAVVAADATLTYAALDQRANQLARHLRRHGVGPEVRVGVCLERSAAMLVALLGILKAGGAFVPLDPAFPPERIGFMLADSRARVLLTQHDLHSRLPATDIAVIRLDSEWPRIAEEPPEPLPLRMSADNLCYQIYTSGSTGHPKGVLVPHRGFVNYLVWCAAAYGAAEGRGAPVQSSIAADAIFPSLFAPLLEGTSVVMIPESTALQALVVELRARGGFSLMKITPSQLEVLNEQIGEDDPRGWVRTLVIGAEALRGTIAAVWQDKAPETIVLNEYGPTETVVGCSIYRIAPATRPSGAVPIGLPIANLEFYVLDRELQPVPVGVAGELYIGGDGLAWGYFGRPDLTAQAFVPHPFSTQPGARLYKTGDVVRLLNDRQANIEFLGRRDHQVKIRGYRVELGEIEATLALHPAVREVVVVARDLPGGPQLHAYIVPSVQPAPPAEAWRSYLQQRLPAYMVPTAFVLLDALPLLPHGKLDRNSMPLPNTTHSPSQQHQAPRTPVEAALAKIWADLLHRDNIGINENFFEIGGHSLLATQVVGRVWEQMQIRVSLRSFFEVPTVAGVAEAVEAIDWATQSAAVETREYLEEGMV
jgi:amino acid adenylation domain-containing protein